VLKGIWGDYAAALDPQALLVHRDTRHPTDIAGLRGKPLPKSFRQRTFKSALRLDVTNVAETLEILEGPNRR
jgi:hypothetical protein